MKKQVEIYTDGACSGNPGVGGWGVVMLYKGHKKEDLEKAIWYLKRELEKEEGLLKAEGNDV